MCSLSAKCRHPRFISIVSWASPFCTQGTYMPLSGSFVTMYLAELHFGNGYMEIGLLISSLHACMQRCNSHRVIIHRVGRPVGRHPPNKRRKTIELVYPSLSFTRNKHARTRLKKIRNLTR